MPSLPTSTCRAPRGGFTLLEMIVVLSIMAIVAGSAIPLASAAINSAARKATLKELDGLRGAALEFFRDTGNLPTSAGDMERDPSLGGWSGPYLTAFSIDRNSGLSQYAVDAWSRAYRFSGGGSQLAITSAGVSGAFDDGDDLSILVDVTPIRRQETLETLRIVNQAIQAYNSAWLSSDPLPATYPGALSKLVSKGYLPATTPFAEDGWGDALQPDPPSLTPVVRVRSSNVAAP